MKALRNIPALPLTAGAISAALFLTVNDTVALACGCIVLCIGILAAWHRTFYGLIHIVIGATFAGTVALWLQPTTLPSNIADGKICISDAYVESTSERAASQAAIINVFAIDNTQCTPFRARIISPAGNLNPGQFIRFQSSFEPVGRYINVPFMTVNELNDRSLRLSATTFVPANEITISGYKSSLSLKLIDIRNTLERYIHSSRLAPEAAGLLAAVCLGTGEAPAYIKESFQQTSLSHLLCVSGFHVAIIAGLISFLLWPIKALRNGGRWRYILMTLLIWIYAAITGLQPSALRAAIMLSTFYLCRLTQIQPNSFNSLTLAVGIMICVNPYWLWSAGFQLSVSAVLGLLIFASAINPVPTRYIHFRRGVEFFAVPFAAMLGTLPIVLIWFHRLPLLSIPLNAIAAIIFPIFMCAGAITVALANTSVASICAFCADRSCSFLVKLSDYAAKYGTNIEGIYLSTETTIALCIIIAAVAIVANTDKLKVRFSACITALCVIAFLATYHQSKSNYELLICGDNGGNRIYEISNGYAKQIICGKPNKSSVPKNYLASRGISDIAELRANTTAKVTIASKTLQIGKTTDYILIDRYFKGDISALLNSYPSATILIGADVNAETASLIENICKTTKRHHQRLCTKAYYTTK